MPPSQAASTAARASSSVTAVNRFPIAAPPNEISVTATPDARAAQRQHGAASRTCVRRRSGHERGLIRRPDMPPSIASAVPVTDDASGLAR